MAHMAILQEIDKCMKCRGCQVACQRVQGLFRVPNYDGVPKIAWDDPMVVKPQAANDSPPYVRYSCWHCDAPPCAPACPLGAMAIDSATGAVYVDANLCVPDNCLRQCRTYCRRGGYVRIRERSDIPNGVNEEPLAFKCHLCYNRPEGPACVETCPAGALTYKTRDEIKALAAAYPYTAGDGHIIWASKKPFTAPASDPFIEDHISPMFGKIAGGSVSKLLTVPTLVAGGLYALYRRRLEVETEGE